MKELSREEALAVLVGLQIVLIEQGYSIDELNELYSKAYKTICCPKREYTMNQPKTSGKILPFRRVVR